MPESRYRDGGYKPLTPPKASVSASRDRRRAEGVIPPLGLICAKMQDDGLPKARPIDFRPSPALQRFHSSALWAAVNPTRRYFLFIPSLHGPRFKVRVALIS